MNAIPVRSPDVVWRDEPRQRAAILSDLEEGKDVGDRGWVIVIDRGVMHELNLTAGDIWCLFDGTRSVAQVASELAERYVATIDEITADVSTFMTDWLERGWIRVKETH